jgi:hypothetical protein
LRHAQRRLSERGLSLTLAAGMGRFIACLGKTRGSGVGGTLELLEPSHAQRAPAVKPRRVEVETLAVVVRRRPQLLSRRLSRSVMSFPADGGGGA